MIERGGSHVVMSPSDRVAADLLRQIREAIVRTGQPFTTHAIARATERRLPVSWAREAIAGKEAEVIENYPADPRGPSCLIYGRAGSGATLHVQVPHPPTIAVIAMYEPDPARWQPDLKTRK